VQHGNFWGTAKNHGTSAASARASTEGRSWWHLNNGIWAIFMLEHNISTIFPQYLRHSQIRLMTVAIGLWKAFWAKIHSVELDVAGEGIVWVQYCINIGWNIYEYWVEYCINIGLNIAVPLGGLWFKIR
jgi:hypothetical protein